MEDLDRKNLGINLSTSVVHIDNFVRDNREQEFKNWCGICPSTHSLKKRNYLSTFKLCKKCSKIYYKKYKEPFDLYITVLKLKNKLFI